MAHPLSLDDQSSTDDPAPAGLRLRPGLASSLVRIATMLAGAAAALALLIHVGVLDPRKLAHAFASLDAGVLAVVVALAVVNNALRGLRWHLLTREIAPHVPLAASFAYMLTGFAFLATPGKIGEIVRLWLLKSRQHVPYNRSLALLLLDRLIDLACLLLLAAGGVALGSLIAHAEHTGAVACAIAALALPFLALTSRRLTVAMAVLGHQLSRRRWPGLFVFALTTDRTLRQLCRPGLIVPALALGLAAWAAQIAAIWLVLGNFGFDGGLLQVAVIYPGALLLGAAAMVPGGADAVLLGMLVVAGMTAEAAVAATLVSRISTWWLAMLVGFCVAPFMLAAGASHADMRTNPAQSLR